MNLAISQPLVPIRKRGIFIGFTAAIVVVLALPFVGLAAQWLAPEYELWSHLAETMLGTYLKNSVLLCAGVMTGTFLIGVTTAWLCGTCDFPGRRFFEWALILPLAYPAYIAAYVYTGMLDYGGSVYALLNDAAWLDSPPPIRSIPGAWVVMSLVLYPYVYLLARNLFMQQGTRLIEAGHTLGAGPLTCFMRISLPAARPAIIAGSAIVMMETLADYGIAEYFGLNTFSVGILRIWFGFGNLAAAAQLSVLLLMFMILVMLVEKHARSRARYYHTEALPTAPIYRLRGGKAAAAVIACALPPLLGFAVPTTQLLSWAMRRLPVTDMSGYTTLVINTFILALISSLAVVLIAVVVSYTKRLYPSAGMTLTTQTVTSGYATPGVVIAIGVLTVLTTFGNWFGAALGGTVLALIFAYTIRFLTLGFNTVEASLEKISPNMDYAAHTLNASGGETLAKIHLPLMRGGLLTATLLVFVEVIKELPATLVLRPFNFNTLAVRAFELASDERLTDIALPALSIIFVSVLPLVVLVRMMRAP